jgi:hypothetical protein
MDLLPLLRFAISQTGNFINFSKNKSCWKKNYKKTRPQSVMAEITMDAVKFKKVRPTWYV